MKRITLLTTILLIINVITFAQKVEWKENGLTWNDFQCNPNLNVLFQSELIYYVGYNTEELKLNDTIIFRYKTYCYVESSSSWVNPNSKTDDLLRYNQVIFDIVELYRRKFQHAINLIDYSYEIESQFSIYNQECSRRITEFKTQSEYGINNSIINYWSETINNELDLTNNEIIPKFNKGTFGYGMHFGLGYGTTTNTLSNHFNSYPFLIYGFDFALKKFALFVNGTMGGGKIRNDYNEGTKNWKKGERFGITIIELSCGYYLIDNSKHKLSPFVGLGIIEFTSGNQDEIDNANELRLYDYNFIAGLNYDYKFRKTLRFISNSNFTNYKESGELSFRTRLYITPTIYYTDLKGMTINFSIGVSKFGRRIKIINE